MKRMLLVMGVLAGLSACAVTTCEINGERVRAGESVQVDCNTCTCRIGGGTECTLMGCGPVDSGGDTGDSGDE